MRLKRDYRGRAQQMPSQADGTGSSDDLLTGAACHAAVGSDLCDSSRSTKHMLSAY